jgi:hypothetical protein
MGRRLATLAAASSLMLSLGAAPALARSASSGPLVHMSLPATALGSMCGYTFTSGVVSDVFSTKGAIIDPTTGEWLYIPAAHVAFHDAWAVNGAGTSFHVVGGETYSDLKGHLASKIMFISPGGGIADSINIVARSYANGELHFAFDLGTCSFA